MSHTPTPSEQLVSAYVEVWNERAYQNIPDLVSDGFVMHDPAVPEEGIPGPKGQAHGGDGLEQFIRGVVAGFPDFHVAVLDLLSRDDVVMYEAEISMTHEGEFGGAPPTGRRAEFRLMSKFVIADDAIQEHSVYFDIRSVYEQLGLADGT